MDFFLSFLKRKNNPFQHRHTFLGYTLDFGMNIGVRLLIFEKKIEGKKIKNDHNALFDVKMN